MSAFSVFFLLSPSFLDYQRWMQKERERNNAKSLFDFHQIPSTQQIGHLLDAIAPAHLVPVLIDLVGALEDAGELASHRVLDGRLPVALDATQSPEAIHGAQCATRTLANGKTQYDHVALTPTLVAPGQAAVFLLPPAFVQPQDRPAKQDCERNAATRWLQPWGVHLAAWRTTVLGDDRYCHPPFCQQVRAQGCEFLCVCLPTYAWVGDFTRTGAVLKTRWTGKQRLTDPYRWLTALPLRDDARRVGWCERTTTDADGTVRYRNAWASTQQVGEANVVAVVETGRSHWNIENDNNTTLKTQGYRFEHHYRHGKQHLAAVLASLTLLAFLAHPVLDRLDRRYQAVRRQVPSRRTFFEQPVCPGPGPTLCLLGPPVRLHARGPRTRPATSRSPSPRAAEANLKLLAAHGGTTANDRDPAHPSGRG